MSPNVALKLAPSEPAEPVIVAIANSNAQTQKPVRRRAKKEPLPPVGTRGISQKVQAADEHWQELIAAHNRRLEDNSKGNDLAMIAALSCFVHSLFDDKNLCGQVLVDFVSQVGKEKSPSGNIFS